MVRAIAFYLPQYHRIKENDEWWGEGFTEWSHVRRAAPFYEGHILPRKPLPPLGYYDLLNGDVMAQQAALARSHGIGGFCFYWYWFEGRRLLERPVEAFLGDARIDMPFCLCWANENWTRAWDGHTRHVLLEQEHSAADDLRFIEAVLPYMKDRRYITVNGTHLLLIYRVEKFPSIADTVARRRGAAREAGIELYLVNALSFRTVNPERIGFDAAYQFPPLFVNRVMLERSGLKFHRPFNGRLLSYLEAARSQVKNRYVCKVFRGVMPSWDNTPRRGDRGDVYHGASPQLFQRWLTTSRRITEQLFSGEEQLLFINAWNEWGETAILEPCSVYGRQYLQAASSALA
jgi:lipopolysaccharide biosynthesis protein